MCHHYGFGKVGQTTPGEAGMIDLVATPETCAGSWLRHCKVLVYTRVCRQALEYKQLQHIDAVMPLETSEEIPWRPRLR